MFVKNGFVYIAGSLANDKIVDHTIRLQNEGIGVFSEWFTPGPDADVNWRTYEQKLGFNFREALKRPTAQHIFCLDKRFIDLSAAMLLVLPAGKSGHLELGYTIGSGKPGFILMDGEPERWDVMYNYATEIFYGIEEAVTYFKEKWIGIGERTDGAGEELRSEEVAVPSISTDQVGRRPGYVYAFDGRTVSRSTVEAAGRLIKEYAALDPIRIPSHIEAREQLYRRVLGSTTAVQDLFWYYQERRAEFTDLLHCVRREFERAGQGPVPNKDAAVPCCTATDCLYRPCEPAYCINRNRPRDNPS